MTTGVGELDQGGPDAVGAREATVELAAGPRAAEARLLEILTELRDEARADPSVLRRPVRVIVPSRSLRLHVCERIAHELGSTLGVEVQTHVGVAIEILERASERAGGGDVLVEVLARRSAAAEQALSEACAPFRDGYRPVVASVRDLLDAGLLPESVEAATECLAETHTSTADLSRAQAVLRTAGAVSAGLRARHSAGRPFLLSRAREVYIEQPEQRLPTRALLVHGFADLTGRAADLIEALLRGTARSGAPAVALVDRPLDPAEPELGIRSPDRGAVFAERFLERLSGLGGPARPLDGSPPPPAVEFFRAPGTVAEVREVARRLRSVLAGGVRPERCAVVARDLGPYRSALRTHFARLGVAFSGLGARAPMDGTARRLRSLLELLERGPEIGVDRWLDSVRGYARPGVDSVRGYARPGVDSVRGYARPGVDSARGCARPGSDEARPSAGQAWRPPSEELRLALRLRGGLTLEAVPGVRLPPGESQRMTLPLRRGVGRLVGLESQPGERGPSDDEGDEPDLDRPKGGLQGGGAGEGRFVAFHQKLEATELEAVRELASRTLARFAAWPARDSVAGHLARLFELCESELGWREVDPEMCRLRAGLEELAVDLGEEPLEREELLALLPGLVESAVDLPLGGEGGGVQVLEVMEARGRTFEHLFVLGLNRDVFPRTLREDPLLGDDLRRALAVLLPEIPIKARGRDEERYLFAQLMAAAPRVTLSWQVAGDDGRARVASPLLARLLGEAGEGAVPQVAAAGDLDEPGPHTAHEAAVRGGLELRTHGHGERLEAALCELGRDAETAAAVAGARARVLEAFERGPFEPRALAPWLGSLGPLDRAGIRPDPRTEPFYVTRFEALARCPWQAVLTRFLKLERPPDPVEDLPTVEPRAVGNVVHAVLERVAATAGVPAKGRLEEALASPGHQLTWPDQEGLDALLEEAARAELERERRPLDGHVRMLAACARELTLQAAVFLQGEARRFEDVRVLGVEVAGSARVELEQGSVSIEFQADRVERREGRVVLSDYKTGKPLAPDAFPLELGAGRALQPAVYALAASTASSGSESKGRYLYFRADPSEVEVGPGLGLGAHAQPFAQAVRTLVRAWCAGALFPRLVEPDDKQPQACLNCEVAEACLRGDSGAHRAVLSLGREEGDGRELPPEAGELFRLHPKLLKAEAKRGRP